MKSKSRLIGFLLTLSIALGAASWWLAGAGERRAAEQSAPSQARAEPSVHPIPGVPGVGRTPPSPEDLQLDTQGVPPDPDRVLRAAGLLPPEGYLHPPERYRRSPVEAYLTATRYPKSMGLLTPDSYERLNPNTRYERPRRLPDAPESKRQESPYRYLFTADRYELQGSERAEIILQVWKDDEPIPTRVLTSAARAATSPPMPRIARGDTPVEPPSPPPAMPLEFEFQGEMQVATLAPEAMFGQYHGTIVVEVEFEYETLTRAGRLTFEYTPSARTPAVFTGTFEEQLVEGSLVIRAGVQVYTAGRFVVDANLFDENRAPVAWTTAKVDLSREDRSVDLVFYGKMLRDAESGGPFVVRDLRGLRVAPDGVPDQERMPDAGAEYKTKGYELSDFTDAIWDSQHKRETLAGIVRDMEKNGVWPVTASR